MRRDDVTGTTPRASGPPLVGLALGLAWGVAARVWMRAISSLPEFSWTGTLSIVLAAGLLGLCVGIVESARRSGRGARWRLAAVPSLLLFMSPGIVLLPFYVLGGWALASRARPTVRAVAVLPLAAIVWWSWQSLDGFTRIVVSTWVFSGGFLGLGLALAAAGAVVARQWPTTARKPALEQARFA